MTVAGIVAEFNPFHKGHEYLINRTRELFGTDCGVICVMSGSAVQRGEFAAFSKFSRAEAAVRCGADLVIELPAPWSLSSAEGFARGAVGLIEGTGAADVLIFGSESGETAALEATAEALLRPEMDELIRSELRSGISYAAARENALRRTENDAAAVTTPNDILAVEYIKVLKKLHSRIRPVAIRRVGASHDGAEEGEIRSASSIRLSLAGGEGLEAVPEAAAGVFAREISEGRGVITMQRLEMALLSRLRMLPPESFAALPGASEGLDRRLYAAVCSQPGLDAILGCAKSKRYAMSRLRRMVMCACLGIRKEDSVPEAPYIKVLAFSPKGREILRQAGKKASLPIITKPASVRKMDERARRVFDLEAGATDLAALCYSRPEDRCPGADFTHGPFILDSLTV